MSTPLRALWEERRHLRGEHNLLAVEADGELAGRVDYFREGVGPPRHVHVLGDRDRPGWHDQLLSLLRDEWHGGALATSTAAG